MDNINYMNSIEYKALKLKFSTLQLTFWCSWCAFTSFAVLYFKSKGMTDSSVGIAISAMTAAGIFGQITFGYICDTMHTIKKVFFIANLLLLFTTLCFFFIKDPILIIAMMAVMGFMQNPQPSLLDAWILKKFVGNEGEYGAIRACASFGFAVFALVYGQIIQHFGWNVIFVFSTAFFSITIIVSFFTDDIPKKESHLIANSTSLSAVRELFLNKKYLFILIVGFLINLSSSTVLLFLPIIMSSVGGNSANYGVALFASVIAEVPTMLFSKNLLQRIRPETALIFVTIISITQFSCLILAKTPLMIIAVSSIQGFSFGTYICSVRRYVNCIAPKQLYTTAQTLYDGTCTGLTGVITGIASGFILQNYGVKRLLTICILLTSTALILLLINYYKSQLHAKQSI